MDNLSIIQTANGVEIDATENVIVEIYAISGERVYRNAVNGAVQIPLETGTYVIRIGEKPENSVKIRI